jgi:hypothetical protein
MLRFRDPIQNIIRLVIDKDGIAIRDHVYRTRLPCQKTTPLLPEFST